MYLNHFPSCSTLHAYQAWCASLQRIFWRLLYNADCVQARSNWRQMCLNDFPSCTTLHAYRAWCAPLRRILWKLLCSVDCTQARSNWRRMCLNRFPSCTTLHAYRAWCAPLRRILWKLLCSFDCTQARSSWRRMHLNHFPSCTTLHACQAWCAPLRRIFWKPPCNLHLQPTHWPAWYTPTPHRLYLHLWGWWPCCMLRSPHHTYLVRVKKTAKLSRSHAVRHLSLIVSERLSRHRFHPNLLDNQSHLSIHPTSGCMDCAIHRVGNNPMLVPIELKIYPHLAHPDDGWGVGVCWANPVHAL